MIEIFKDDYFSKWYPDREFPAGLAKFCNAVVQGEIDDGRLKVNEGE